MRWYKKYSKIIRFATMVLALMIVVAPNIAYAEDASFLDKVWGWFTAGTDIIGGIAISAILLPLAVIVYVASYIGSLLFQFASYLVGAALEFNGALLDSGNAVINIGWNATRELANLGFVLGIIIIAFATIIRYESYGAKQLLWRLIVVALLVNFSLTIAAVFIDFAGVLSDLFFNAISGEGTVSDKLALSNQLTAAFGPQKLVKAFETGSATDVALKFAETALDTKGALNLITSLFFATIFIFLMAIAMLVLMVMLFLRFVILNFLLVLVPLAFLFWIFPKFQNLWTQWWNEFFRWVFFLPASMFFLYLAITIARSGSDYMERISSITTRAGEATGLTTGSAILIDNFFGNAAQMLVVLFFVYFGLILAHKISGTFSGVATKTGGLLSNKLTTWARSGAVGAGLGMAGWAGKQTLALGGKEGKPTYAQRFARTLARAPVIRGLGQRLDIASQAAKERVQKQVDERGKQSKEYIQAEMSSRKFVPVNKEMAAAEYISAKKMGVEIPDNLIKRYEIAIKATGTANELLQYAPERAKEFGKNEYEVVLGFSPSKLTQMLNEGTQQQRDELEKILKDAASIAAENKNLIQDADKDKRLKRNLERLQNMPIFQAYLGKPISKKKKKEESEGANTGNI